jgi:C1A family cysteine protease
MAEPRKIEKYGWIRQHPDARDRPFAVEFGLDLPAHFDLLKQSPPIWNQGREGSCTAHGSLRAYWMDRKKLGLPTFMPSRQFQYWNSRALMSTTAIDSGATVRDAIKAIASWGACDEALWPYDKGWAPKPSPEAYTAAAPHKAIAYEAVPQDLYSIKSAILQGYAVVFGFTVYSNFEGNTTSRTGMMSMPQGGDLGGHCVAAIGWNSHNYFAIANSWSNKWGDPNFGGGGYFWMPPEYISSPNLASDFWVIKVVQP